MKTGTKSLLFGVHQFFWHPLTVWIAWVWLYRKIPTLKETLCIIIHDWGYWGCANMDDAQGEKHVELGAKLASRLLGPEYHELCLYHSRHYAKQYNRKPSLLCWADKVSIVFDPWWFYLPRAYLSGELFEYRRSAIDYIPLEDTHRKWYKWLRQRLITVSKKSVEATNYLI